VANPVSACYCATKIFNAAFPTLLGSKLREGLLDHGVDQMIVKPGLVQTNMVNNINGGISTS
jgi:NADP-dependent 3-hydroxy acid dehydrogenase YdfG